MSIVPKDGEPTQAAAPDSEQAGRERVAGADKRVARLQAQAALAGWVCHTVHDGFLFGRWGYTHHAPDIEAAEAFLARAMGVGHAR